ncbi:nuclear transport factor 2 family protein [Pseudoruegeria sp. HB172150]|uniref:nuclear transport factor 2 family protein n=1 Tax=Pseudoruegeria sp. HB172150 TaxID=2721164 RepID=UPI001552B62D|nr:nuclear transport factor 2 family protein [Pseudoruegeria sp. HB172150]
MKKSVISLVLTAAMVLPAAAAEVRSGVTYDGPMEPEGSDRAVMQALMFDIATAWAACDTEAMEGAITDDVHFSYPTSVKEGREAVMEDLALFCDNATDTSIYFPKDAFYIDVDTGRVAAEVQFRTFQRGSRQVVNDVWVAHVADGKVSVIKEYLDGRVKDLQALGVLTLEESPEVLTPWPPRTEEWAECFPIVKAAPINECPSN